MTTLTETKAKQSSTALAHLSRTTAGTTSNVLQQYLTFVLGGEVFALDISNIKEIIQYGPPTEVPMMPSYIRGVINLRGKVVPIVDLSARFSRGLTQVARRTSIVVIEIAGDTDSEGTTSDGQHIGVMVDAVNEVVEIDANDIEPPPSYGARIRSDFISGMAKRDGRFIIVLNLSQVLSIEEMASFDQSKVTSNSAIAAVVADIAVTAVRDNET